jgi:hypothetical protein
MIVMPGAAPSRQQRGVNVEAAKPGQFEHPLRQDQPVGGDHHQVGPGGFERGARLLRVVRVLAIEPQAARLGHVDAVFDGESLHRRSLQLQAAAGGPVRLREHQRNREAGGMQPLERRAGEFRRSGKDDAHRGRERSCRAAAGGLRRPRHSRSGALWNSMPGCARRTMPCWSR